MPGKKGVKLMSRLSKSGKWSSVKELVFSLLEANPNIRKQDVDREVAKEYPTAGFLKHDKKRGHFAWYKHRFMREKLEAAEFNIKEPKREVEVKVEEPQFEVEAVENVGTVEPQIGKLRRTPKAKSVKTQKEMGKPTPKVGAKKKKS